MPIYGAALLGPRYSACLSGAKNLLAVASTLCQAVLFTVCQAQTVLASDTAGIDGGASLSADVIQKSFEGGARKTASGAKTKNDLGNSYAESDLVIEYFNPTIKNGGGTAGAGHYFITAAAAEAISIDAGGSGPGWGRTHRKFRAWIDPAKAPIGAVGVCRFYARVPNSHFYTASAAECESLKTQNPSNSPDLGWSFEGIAFYTVLPADGSCDAGYHPIYRSYNNRFNNNNSLNDSNHRITPSYNDNQRSTRFFGFIDEGIAFCSPISPDPGGDLEATYSYPGASIPEGAPFTAEFLFSNNGPGSSDGATVHFVVPAATVLNIACTSRGGATCPIISDPSATLGNFNYLVAGWPAGGTLNFTMSGIAADCCGGDSGGGTDENGMPISITRSFGLVFIQDVRNTPGSPDPNPHNNRPPAGATAVTSTKSCNQTPSLTRINAGAEAQSLRFYVSLGSCAFTAKSYAPWMNITPAAGLGPGQFALEISLLDNSTLAAREGFIDINSSQVYVKQLGVQCNITVSPGSLALTSSGQTTLVSITAPAACSWTTQSNASWITLGTASNSGDTNLTITVQSNPGGVKRTGTVTVGNFILPIVQSGGTEIGDVPPELGYCSGLELSRTAEYVVGDQSTGPQLFDVFADPECIWSPKTDVKWITITDVGSGSGYGAVKFRLDRNDGPVRTGTITIAKKTFTVNQDTFRASGGVGGSTGGSSDGGGGGSGSGDGGSSGGSAG